MDTSEIEGNYEKSIEFVNEISSPLAGRKLTKRVYKLVKKAKVAKKIRKGVREVQKFVRKGDTGILVIAGNVYPIDVVSHMPVYCEERGIPYVFVPLKEDLGAALGSKRSTCMVLVKSAPDYEDLFDECESKIKQLPPSHIGASIV